MYSFRSCADISHQIVSEDIRSCADISHQIVSEDMSDSESAAAPLPLICWFLVWRIISSLSLSTSAASMSFFFCCRLYAVAICSPFVSWPILFASFTSFPNGVAVTIHRDAE